MAFTTTGILSRPSSQPVLILNVYIRCTAHPYSRNTVKISETTHQYMSKLPPIGRRTPRSGQIRTIKARLIPVDEFLKSSNDFSQIRCRSYQYRFAATMGYPFPGNASVNLQWPPQSHLSRFPRLRRMSSNHLPGSQAIQYLQYYLNETLHIAPVVPVNIQGAVQDTALQRGGGPKGQVLIFVSKDMVICHASYPMHMWRDL